MKPPPALPTVGMLIRDSERLAAQLVAILDREIDPASLPTSGLTASALESLRTSAGYHADAVLRDLAAMAELPLVGSAHKLPARQDPAADQRGIATTGGPGQAECFNCGSDVPSTQVMFEAVGRREPVGWLGP